MKHDWVLYEDGSIDTFQLEYEYHNGPRCKRCGEYFCEHCHRNLYDEECPSGQLNWQVEGGEPHAKGEQ